MLRVLYCSRSAIGTPPNRLVHDILTVSRRNNVRDGITGALLFSGDYVAQFLEGPALAVERTLERIAHDPRHGDMAVQMKSAVAERIFPDWSMALSIGDQERQDACSAVFERAFRHVMEPPTAELLQMIRDGIADLQIW